MAEKKKKKPAFRKRSAPKTPAVYGPRPAGGVEGETGPQRPKMQGLQVFFISFLSAVLVILPIFAVAAGVQVHRLERLQAQAADKGATGVAVAKPGAEDAMTLLLFSADASGEAGDFLLVRADALQNTVVICPLPACTVVRAGQGVQTLNQAQASGGPALAALYLSDTLEVPVPFYIKIQQGQLARILAALGRFQLDLSQWQGQGAGLKELTDGAGVYAALQSGALSPEQRASLRGLTVRAVLEAGVKPLMTQLLAALREGEGSQTNLNAVELYKLEKIGDFLARQAPEIRCVSLGGAQKGDRYELSADSPAAAAGLYGKRQPASSDTAESGAALSAGG